MVVALTPIISIGRYTQCQTSSPNIPRDNRTSRIRPFADIRGTSQGISPRTTPERARDALNYDMVYDNANYDWDNLDNILYDDYT